MARAATTYRNVGFAREVTTIRPPREDELSVMGYFARHAAKCDHCRDPYQAFQQDRALCSRGRSYAKDVARYLYPKGGKPFSVLDRDRGDRVQVEVPADCSPVNQLIRAMGRGMSLNATQRPAIIQDTNTHRPVSSSPTSRYPPAEERPRERRYLPGNYDLVEIVPNSSRHERRERAYRSSRLQDRDEYERTPRQQSHYHGSLYTRDEEQSRRRRQYENPVTIIVEPRRRYTERR